MSTNIGKGNDEKGMEKEKGIGSCSSTNGYFLLRAFRHVILPKELAKTLPKSRLLTESEWRSIGVQQSRGWQHYAIHRYVF